MKFILFSLFCFLPYQFHSDEIIFHWDSPDQEITNELSESIIFRGLDKSVNQYLSSSMVVGGSVAVMRNGKLIFAKGYGFVNLDRKVLVQPYNRFRIASISKLITAIAIMKLVESGELSLNSKVFGTDGILNNYDYENIIDSRVFNITVDNLLRHNAGWSLLTFGDPMFRLKYIANELGLNRPPSFNEIIQFVLLRKLPYSPGSRYEYSNFGYCLLGAIVEKITNMSYSDFVTYKIFYPNSIKNTYLGSIDKELLAENEVEYFDLSSNNTRASFYDSDRQLPRAYSGTDLDMLGAAGGWVSTSVDLLKLISLIDGYPDVPDILDKDTLLKMIEVDGYPSKIPIGWRRILDNWNWIRTGTLSGTNSIVVRQEDGFSWVAIINTSNWRTRRFHSQISNLMSNELSKIDSLPDINLFDYSNN